MSRWLHAMCVACWNERHPSQPAVVISDLAERSVRCCWCDEATVGLVRRADPADVPCAGIHFDDDPEGP